jgi:hypothetical protein
MIETYQSPVPVTWWKVMSTVTPRFLEPILIQDHPVPLNPRYHIVPILSMISGDVGYLGLSLTAMIRRRMQDLLELAEFKAGHFNGVIEEISVSDSITGPESYSIKWGLNLTPKKLEPRFTLFGRDVVAEEFTVEECHGFHLPYWNWTPPPPEIHRPTRFDREDVV